MPVMGFTKFERFLRAAGGVDVDRDDFKRYLDFVNDASLRPAGYRLGRSPEIPFTAFGSRTKADQVAGRLVVRRIPDINAPDGQSTLFELWRFHAFFTTSGLDTVTADATHRATRSSSRSTPT